MLLAAGCGGGTVPVEGKAVKGGQPYNPAKDGDLNIVLTAAEGGKNFSGKVAEDGNFKINAVPAGKYNVTVTIYPPIGGGGGPPAPGDKKGPPMSGTKKLDESWEVSSSNKSFTLDVAKLK
jgi:hypothetical protein